MTWDVVKSENIIDVEVKNTAKEDLGKIEEIVIDKRSGNVCYLVLSFGGILGMGDKLFAIPWNAINYDKKEECFILNADKERLKNAPGFDKNNWPNMADEQWAQSIRNYYPPV